MPEPARQLICEVLPADRPGMTRAEIIAALKERFGRDMTHRTFNTMVVVLGAACAMVSDGRRPPRYRLGSGAVLAREQEVAHGVV